MCRRSLMNGTRKLSSFLFLEKNSFSRSNLQHRRHSAPVLHSAAAAAATTATIADKHFPIGTPAPLQQQKMLHHCHNYNFDKTAAILSRRLNYSSESTPKANPNTSPEMKHQEIEGPTVEKDVSPLADESRKVTESLLKTMYNASGVLALLGLGHLGMGTYYCYCYTITDGSASSSSSSSSGQMMMMMFVMSALAFGFPFSMALMLRQSLKSMHFFQKMEQIGRLQILTSTMQISKQLRLFFLRLRAISYLYLAEELQQLPSHLGFFLQVWSSKFFTCPTYPASFERSVILDADGLQSILLEQWLGLESNPTLPMKMLPLPPRAHVSLRSTFVMGSADVANAKRWFQALCDKPNISYPVLLSPYVVTCALVWTCFLRARVQNSVVTKAKAKDPMYVGFIAGAITRLPYWVSTKYLGNCVGFGRAVAMREELLKEGEGMLAAADAIGLTIKMLDSDVLGGAEKWISEWQTLIESENHIHVVGLPKANLYETDFGWGKPKKIEEISIDGTRAISLTQSRAET